MTIPALSSHRCTADMAERVARALNLVGTDGSLLGMDADTLLKLIDEYLADNKHKGIQGSPTFLTQTFNHYSLSIKVQ